MSIFFCQFCLKERCVPLKYLKLMPDIQEAKCFECTVQILPPPLRSSLKKIRPPPLDFFSAYALDTFLSYQLSILSRILNRIEQKIFISKTNVLILTHAMFAKESKKPKTNLTKKILKRLKRVKDIIKHKGCQKSARVKKMLKNARFMQNLYIFFTTH